MPKTNIGQGKQALALSGGGVAGYFNTSGAITYTATTVTPTASPAWTVSTSTNFGTPNVWTGYIVIAGAFYGVITSNTATALTIDKWYNPAAPTSGTVVGPPAANTAFVILPGNAPCFYMGIGTAGAIAVTDIALVNEQSTLGLGRAAATYAHTYSNASTNNTYTLTNTFTYTGSSGVTLVNIGIFDALTNGIPLFTTAMSSPATVSANGDAVTCTDTVTM